MKLGVTVHFKTNFTKLRATVLWFYFVLVRLESMKEYYRNFCGFYRCVNQPRRINHKLLSLWVIRRSLHIDKIYKNNVSFLIIPTSNSYFVESIAHFRSWRKKNSSEILAHGIFRNVKHFLQPIKLREISTMLKSWNYRVMKMYRKTLILWLCVFTTNRFVLILSLFLILVFDSVLFSIMITSHGEESWSMWISCIGWRCVCVFILYVLPFGPAHEIMVLIA